MNKLIIRSDKEEEMIQRGRRFKLEVLEDINNNPGSLKYGQFLADFHFVGVHSARDRFNLLLQQWPDISRKVTKKLRKSLRKEEGALKAYARSRNKS